MSTLRVRALYMRGGTSKGLFFRQEDLPANTVARDRLLLRAMGSPDTFGTQMDGMGAGSSSTSKVMVVRASGETSVEYRFGQVAIDRGVIDWSGSCGNLAAAVGAFAIWRRMVRVPQSGWARLRLMNLENGSLADAEIPVENGEPVEVGEFELDGVGFPGAEIRLAFLVEDRAGAELVFATGAPMDVLDVPGVGAVPATLVQSGNPTVIVEAAALGLRGDETQQEVNGDHALLARLEAVRAQGAVRMGMASTADEASRERLHAPKIAFVAPASSYVCANGRKVAAAAIDLKARTISMGKLHHAMTGTGAVAIGMAAALPGTVVERVLGGPRTEIRIGHAAGTMRVGAEVVRGADGWTVTKALLSRSARRLMEGEVLVPATDLCEQEGRGE